MLNITEIKKLNYSVNLFTIVSVEKRAYGMLNEVNIKVYAIVEKLKPPLYVVVVVGKIFTNREPS